MKVGWAPSTHMLADVLTKMNATESFKKCRGRSPRHACLFMCFESEASWLKKKQTTTTSACPTDCATSTAWMPGGVNTSPSACKDSVLSPTRKRKSQPSKEFLTQASHCSPPTALSVLLQPGMGAHSKCCPWLHVSGAQRKKRGQLEWCLGACDGQNVVEAREVPPCAR